MTRNVFGLNSQGLVHRSTISKVSEVSVLVLLSHNNVQSCDVPVVSISTQCLRNGHSL